MLEQTSYAQWVGSILGEYRLARPLGTSPMGPLFIADSVNSASTFLVRVLTVPPAQTPEMMRTYQAYLERQAGHVSALRHPYMLSLVNYGIYQGLPYLVWPYTSMRSLATRINQSGVLDVVTMGRYIDQIAAALEYAHQHATFHRNLSLDCIYLQMDGQIAVADFGVRRLYELLTPGAPAGFFYGSLEALAPEQLTGGQIGSYTDVYALGGVTFRLLTGQPLFGGESFREVAEQHLQAPPPSLARTRAGLPGALDRVLASALAKDPAQRIQHPGALADVYHRVIAPANTMRVPFEVSGQPAQPAPAAHSSSPAQRASDVAVSTAHISTPAEPADSARDAATAPQGWRQFFARSWWFFLIVLVLVPLASVGIFHFANSHNGSAIGPSGTLVFADSAVPPDGNTDGLQFTVRDLPAPAADARYEVWLVDQKTEHITALGTLTSGANATYRLVYVPASSNGKPAVNVLSLGDLVEITEEQRIVAAPAGHIVLAAKFPPQAFVHIGHLLLAYPTTPGNIGLLVGVLRQAQLLDTQASALNNAAKSGHTSQVQCLAQSIVDISEGTNGAHYQPLGEECKALGVTDAGDGFGLLSPKTAASGVNGAGAYSGKSETTGYVKNAADHASLATATPDATEVLRQHASQIEATLAELTRTVAAADNAALTLLKTPTDAAAVASVVTACAEAYQGKSTSDSSGAITAYLQGQQMATLSLAPPAA